MPSINSVGKGIDILLYRFVGFNGANVMCGEVSGGFGIGHQSAEL